VGGSLYEYLRIFGGPNAQGSVQAGGSGSLPSGRICLAEKYSNITQTLNFTETTLHCLTMGKFINEIAWVAGKRVIKQKNYAFTGMSNLNTSQYSATPKTTIIYNNEEGNFTYS